MAAFIATRAAQDDSVRDPMGEINTTPLIDVMLVLLIMFVITIPAATHSVQVELPGEGPRPQIELNQTRNRLVLTANDRLLWNGTALDQAQLASVLAATRELAPEPELQFQPEERASYEIVNRTVRTIKRSGVARFGFVGNERYRNFASAD